MKEFFPEEIDTKDREGAEEDGGKLQSGDGITNERDEQGLDIDEEPFSTIISGIKEFVGAGFERVESVDAVGSLIRVETDRNRVNIEEADRKS